MAPPCIMIGTVSINMLILLDAIALLPINWVNYHQFYTSAASDVSDKNHIALPSEDPYF